MDHKIGSFSFDTSANGKIFTNWRIPPTLSKGMGVTVYCGTLSHESMEWRVVRIRKEINSQFSPMCVLNRKLHTNC